MSGNPLLKALKINDKPKARTCSHCGKWLEPFVMGHSGKNPVYAIGHTCPQLIKDATSDYSNIWGN